MKRWFEDASIRWKLTALMAGTTALALGLAALSLGTYEVATFRRTLEQKLIVVSEIVGRNCTAALAFGDKTVARDVLAALDAEPSIEAGAVFDKDGRVFATYVAPAAGVALPASPGEVGNRVSAGRMIVVRSIVLEGETVGTVYVQSTLSELSARMLVFAGITLITVVACGVIALFTSAGLQGRISKPILDLANTARLVTSDRNFSLRANPAGRDEVGMLVQDFNRMLAEIERQDRQLRQQQESLTEEVTSRTAELVEANQQLTVSVRRVEHYAEQIAQLTALGQLLQSCLTADEVYGVIQNALPRLFPGDSGSITILKSSGNLMETMAVGSQPAAAARVRTRRVLGVPPRPAPLRDRAVVAAALHPPHRGGRAGHVLRADDGAGRQRRCAPVQLLDDRRCGTMR
ncbi:MAG TPA: CHASE sensor domain-containing protein [Vicinamibacterales bacterium]|nr:CHASE sensor domain-containing protein [Vicinamibacterales bacterium]